MRPLPFVCARTLCRARHFRPNPAVTGRGLAGGSAERRYEGFLAAQEAAFTDALARAVPAASVNYSLRTVYGGVAVTVPANRISDVLALDGVAAVQADQRYQVQTDSSPDFIGADTPYPDLGGADDAGKEMVTTAPPVPGTTVVTSSVTVTPFPFG